MAVRKLILIANVLFHYGCSTALEAELKTKRIGVDDLSCCFGMVGCRGRLAPPRPAPLRSTPPLISYISDPRS